MNDSMPGEELLALLRCPQDHSTLKPMTKAALGALNKKIEKGGVTHGDGRARDEAIDVLLVREDGLVGYLCEDGVALLNAQDAVVLKG